MVGGNTLGNGVTLFRRVHQSFFAHRSRCLLRYARQHPTSGGPDLAVTRAIAAPSENSIRPDWSGGAELARDPEPACVRSSFLILTTEVHSELDQPGFFHRFPMTVVR